MKRITKLLQADNDSEGFKSEVAFEKFKQARDKLNKNISDLSNAIDEVVVPAYRGRVNGKERIAVKVRKVQFPN